MFRHESAPARVVPHQTPRSLRRVRTAPTYHPAYPGSSRELLEAGGESSLGRHFIQQHVPITRQNYNVDFYWPIVVVEGCPEKATYRDARS